MTNILPYLLIALKLPERYSDSGKFLYETLSSIAVVSGSVFLWLTFIFLGLIAKRYETVLRKKTRWLYMIVAPSGVLIATIIQVYSYVFLFPPELILSGWKAWVAFSLFFISACVTLFGAWQFKQVVTPSHKKG